MPGKASPKPWDLTSASSLSGALDWLRKRSGAALIVAVRRMDVGIAIDPGLQPLDATTMLRDELPRLLQYLIDERARKAIRERQARRDKKNLDAEDPE